MLAHDESQRSVRAGCGAEIYNGFAVYLWRQILPVDNSRFFRWAHSAKED